MLFSWPRVKSCSTLRVKQALKSVLIELLSSLRLSLSVDLYLKSSVTNQRSHFCCRSCSSRRKWNAQRCSVQIKSRGELYVCVVQPSIFWYWPPISRKFLTPIPLFSCGSILQFWVELEANKWPCWSLETFHKYSFVFVQSG
jgi:hypothetical protein